MRRKEPRCVLLLVVAVLLTGIAGISCRDQEAEVDRQEEEARTAETLSRLRDICARYKPDHESFESVRWQLSHTGLYTIEVEDLLLQRQGRPLIGALPITDVRRDTEGYRLIAADSVCSLYLSLKCSEAQAEHAVSASKDDIRGYPDFVLLFRPQAVHRPLAELVTYSDDRADYPISLIEVEAADLCVIEGKCLELLYVGYMDIDLEEIAGKGTPGEAAP